MSNITPGPWSFDHSSISWWINAPSDLSRFASGPIPVEVWHLDADERSKCQALANARAISAVPELIEALQGLLAGVYGDGYVLPAGEFATRRARAALAKALGTQSMENDNGGL